MKKIFILSLASLFLFSSCRSFKDPVFDRIENVEMGSLNITKPVITLQMKCFNPNNRSAILKNGEGDAWIDSSYLGHFTIDSAINIPANSDFRIPVSLALDIKSVLQNSMALISKEQVNIKVSGKVKAGRKGFYKNVPINYEGPQNLKELFR